MRQMLIVGENSKKHIEDYTKAFTRDFLQLLRTSHSSGKFVNANHFYNTYIANKQHIHLNATHFKSLTEFTKYLGREGICKVQEGERGLEIAWIDNSPEAMRRQDALRKKERQDKGDEDREQRMIAEQVERARKNAEGKGRLLDDDLEESSRLEREGKEKIKLDFKSKNEQDSEQKQKEVPAQISSMSTPDIKAEDIPDPEIAGQERQCAIDQPTTSSEVLAVPSTEPIIIDEKPKVSLSISSDGKPKNVFAAAKKKALGGQKSVPKLPQQRPMTNAERIMNEEKELKRKRESMAGGNFKKPRLR